MNGLLGESGSPLSGPLTDVDRDADSGLYVRICPDQLDASGTAPVETSSCDYQRTSRAAALRRFGGQARLLVAHLLPTAAANASDSRDQDTFPAIALPREDAVLWPGRGAAQSYDPPAFHMVPFSYFEL
jgi:hypothetical protein